MSDPTDYHRKLAEAIDCINYPADEPSREVYRKRRKNRRDCIAAVLASEGVVDPEKYRVAKRHWKAANDAKAKVKRLEAQVSTQQAAPHLASLGLEQAAKIEPEEPGMLSSLMLNSDWDRKTRQAALDGIKVLRVKVERLGSAALAVDVLREDLATEKHLTTVLTKDSESLREQIVVLEAWQRGQISAAVKSQKYGTECPVCLDQAAKKLLSDDNEQP